MMEELAEEEKMRRLRSVVDRAEAVLMRPGLSPEDACRVMEETREAVLSLFPDKEDVYELIYTPRFRRIIAERFTIPGSISGRN